jgi:hypothetical protein
MLRTPDQHRAMRLKRRAHTIGAGRALRPTKPRRQIRIGSPGQSGLITPLGQNPPGGIGNGHDTTKVTHLMCHRRGTKTQLSKYNIMLRRMVDLRDGNRSMSQVRVDAVMLPATMPGDRHLRPNTRNLILAPHEPLPRREHRATARVRRHRLTPMHISHGEEPPLVHPQHPTAYPQSTPVAARHDPTRSGPDTTSRAYPLRHSFPAMPQTDTPTLSPSRRTATPNFNLGTVDRATHIRGT